MDHAMGTNDSNSLCGIPAGKRAVQVRIPMLFIISAYLFALHDDQPRGQRVKKRLRTLGLPYILWSGIGIGLTYVLELIPVTREVIADSHVVQIDETRMLIHDYHWYEALARWVFHPVSYQLWFIRVLLIYNLAYPLILKAVLHRIARPIFFTFVTLMWIGTFGFVFFEGEGLLFFSLGVWIQKTGFSIEQANGWTKPVPWFVAFFALALAKTWLAFHGMEMIGGATEIVMTLIHKAMALSGLIGMWFGSDAVVHWFMRQKWFVWISAFSFVIYAMHAPFVAYFINPGITFFLPLSAARLLAFIFLPLLIIGICVLVGSIIRAITPEFYSLLTGGRGFQKSES